MQKNPGKTKTSRFNRVFNKVAAAVTKAAGSPIAIISAILLVLLWSVGGFIFGFFY